MFYDSDDYDYYYDESREETSVCQSCEGVYYSSDLKGHHRDVLRSAKVDHLHFLFSSQKIHGSCMCIDCGNTFMNVKSLLQHIGGKAKHDDDHAVLFDKIVESYHKHLTDSTPEDDFIDAVKAIMIDKPATCFACNVHFDREYSLDDHLTFKIKRAHFDHMNFIYENQPNVSLFRCCVCGNRFNTLKLLLKHIGYESDFCSCHKSLFKDIFSYFKRRCYNNQALSPRDTFIWIQKLYLDVIKNGEFCYCCKEYYVNIRDHIEEMLKNARMDHLELVSNAFRVVNYACKACGNSFNGLKPLIQHIGAKFDHKWLLKDIADDFMTQSFFENTYEIFAMPAWKKRFYTHTLSLVLQEVTVTQPRATTRPTTSSSTGGVGSSRSATSRVSSASTAYASASSESRGGTCSICLVKKCNHVAIPCGHVAFCEECVDPYRRRGLPCPLCRTHINIFNKIYLPA